MTIFNDDTYEEVKQSIKSTDKAVLLTSVDELALQDIANEMLNDGWKLRGAFGVGKDSENARTLYYVTVVRSY